VEFEQQAQEDLYARVSMLLHQAFGDLAEGVEDHPSFVVELGRVRVLVMVDANGPEKASVMIYKGLGEGLAVTADVAMCLLRKAEDIPFATLSLSDEDHISIRHVVFGEAVTRGNLSMLLRMFAASCGDIEDELTMQFR
jgi:hypothetical protein